MREAALVAALALSLPAHAEDPPAERRDACAVALIIERGACIRHLEHLAAELRVAEEALRAAPEPPSRVTWFAVGAGAGLALALALMLAP